MLHFKQKYNSYVQRPRGNDDTIRLVRMAMALPLVPGDTVEQAINLIANENIPAPGVNAFVTYLRTWVNRNISVFGEDRRTNNSVESFHRDLFRMVRQIHTFITCGYRSMVRYFLKTSNINKNTTHATH